MGDPGQIDAVRAWMKALVADNPEVTVSDPAEQVKQATTFLYLLLTVLNVLLGLTTLVAVFRVINTLLLSVFERTRELGMLRAVGMSRGRMGWMITVEAVLISVFGTALGITLVKIFGGQYLKLTMPCGYLVITLIAAIVAGLVAALLPALRAARLNVLQAIAYE